MNGLGTAFATYLTILTENARNDKDMPNTPRWTSCGAYHNSDDECPHKDWDCHSCNKKGHGSRNCDFVTKSAKERASNKGKAKFSKARDDDSDDDKRNVTMATRWIGTPRMFSDVSLNLSMITENQLFQLCHRLYGLLVDLSIPRDRHGVICSAYYSYSPPKRPHPPNGQS